MASTSLTTPIRRRLSAFAGVARPFTDSRRRAFVTDMLTGLVAAGHVHLTTIAPVTLACVGPTRRRPYRVD